MKKVNLQPKANRLDFMNQYVDKSTNEVTKQSETLIASKHIQDNILEETKKFAVQIANSLKHNEDQAPKRFNGIRLNSKNIESFEYLKFQLVNDFLESIGCKFTPSIFRHESQNPTTMVNRSQIADFLQLRSYDQTPLLVQLIELLRNIQSDK